VDRNWTEIPDHFPNIVLDEYVIMPKHFHGILIIKSGDIENAVPERAPASDAPPLTPVVSGVERLGSIIGSFKSRCVVDHLKYIEDNGLKETGKIWQRNIMIRSFGTKRICIGSGNTSGIIRKIG